MKTYGCIPTTIALVLFFAGPVWAEGHSTGEAHAMDMFLRPRDWVALVFCAFGFLYLVKSRLRHNVRLFSLGLAFFTFGIFSALPCGKLASAMALHPSPLCTITKPFLFLQTGYAVPLGFIILLGFMGILTIIGNKLFCGWSCPIGAIQEIVHRIPLPRRFKRKLPFRASNSLRVLLFAIFLVIAFSLSRDMYDYVNPFEALHWDFELYMITVFCIVLAASFFMYRPFCYFICPAGLFTWGLEHISIVRVKVDKDACDGCQLCVKESPCPAVPAILKGKRSRPDCHACGICIAACPKHALEFRT
jgi:polyferredoxin